jgi:hypothetical protein
LTTLALSEKILLVEEAFSRARIPHAFGGALALAYYGTPRATIDIDVNVFVPVSRADAVIEVLGRLGVDPPSPGTLASLKRDEQTRLLWERTPIDVFFAYDAFHDTCLERRRAFPFGEGDTLHVLSAEDLIVFKVIFDRPKDWRDIDEILYAMPDEVDAGYVMDWVDRIVGLFDPRRARVAESLKRAQ